MFSIRVARASHQDILGEGLSPIKDISANIYKKITYVHNSRTLVACARTSVPNAHKITKKINRKTWIERDAQNVYGFKPVG